MHSIIVVNEAPLSNILNNPEVTGCVSLWGIELSPLDITYEKRKAIKSQVLLDFTVSGQCTLTGRKGYKEQEQG
jgi:hypothetical protein